MTAKTYKKMPPGIKNILRYGYSLLPLRWRLGDGFYQTLKFLEKSQWWSAQELEHYQNEQLASLACYCYDNVPYYHDLFKAENLTPKDIRTIHDLPKLPILTKETVRQNYARMRATNMSDKDIVKLYTSGTTGDPLTVFYEKKREYLNYDPFIWRFFGWGGHTIGQRRATISAWTIPGNRIYDFNPVRNILILSAYTLNQERAPQYVTKIARFGIRYLDGYPSAIEFLTKFLKKQGIARPAPLKAIFVHSEYFYPWQRKIIEEYWGCRCFDWYGTEERVVLGVECEHHQGLHLCSDFGITEFTDGPSDGIKNLIVTSLTNYAMPLLRYDIGDVGIPVETPCSCGRGFPLFSLKGGRKRSFAIGKDGSLIAIANIDVPGLNSNVIRFQFVQEKPGEMSLRIVKAENFDQEDLAFVKEKMAEKFGQNLDVSIHFVDHMEQTKNRKTELFVQKIKGI